MKKILFILAIFVLTTSISQTNSINSRELTINNIEVFGMDKTTLVQKFGNPLSIIQEYFEMDELYAQKYTYSGIIFYITEGTVEIFKISNENFSFSKYNIKVCDHISKLQSYYPISYSNRRNNAIILMLSDLDASLVIEYNTNNLITSIELFMH